jgi:hypothetical protein
MRHPEEHFRGNDASVGINFGRITENGYFGEDLVFFFVLSVFNDFEIFFPGPRIKWNQ